MSHIQESSWLSKTHSWQNVLVSSSWSSLQNIGGDALTAVDYHPVLSMHGWTSWKLEEKEKGERNEHTYLCILAYSVIRYLSGLSVQVADCCKRAGVFINVTLEFVDKLHLTFMAPLCGKT